MSNILFVCYQHGCKGEGLSVKISKHDTFKTLNANVVNNRTVILDEYFNKKFLCSWPQNFSNLKNKSKEKVDPVVALVMALGCYLTTENAESIYDTRGVLTL